MSEWERLQEVAPCLEELHAPWLENLGCESADIDQDMWDKLHEPPLGTQTSDECLLNLGRLTNLREVDLSNVYTITDAGLRTLASLQRLERLHLRNMGRHVTGAGIRALAVGRAPLRELDLRECLDTGSRPSRGRTSVSVSDIAELRRLRPEMRVLLS